VLADLRLRRGVEERVNLSRLLDLDLDEPRLFTGRDERSGKKVVASAGGKKK
jgi:hypothetical protein